MAERVGNRTIKEPAWGARPRLMDKSVMAENRPRGDWDCGCGRGPHRYYLGRCPSPDCRVLRRHAG